MSLAESRAAEQEQRVERRVARSLRDAVSCGYAHLVAFALHEVVETIDRIKSWVDLYLLETREYKRSGISCRRISIDAYRFVDRDIAVGGWERHRRLGGHHLSLINEFCACAYDSFEGLLENIQIKVFKILPIEIGRNLYSYRLVLEGDRNDRLEPHIELLRFNDLFDDPETVIPYVNMCVVSVHYCFSRLLCKIGVKKINKKLKILL